jgi:hypothetical protein
LIVVGLSFAPVFAGCGSDDEEGGVAPVAGTLVQEVSLDIGGGSPSVVNLGAGSRGAQVDFPANVTRSRTRVTVRLTEGVQKSGAVPASTVVQIASRGVVFDAPARVRQPVPPPPLMRRYVPISSDESAAPWTPGITPARQVAAPPGSDPTLGPASGLIWCEIDISGFGLWALFLQDVGTEVPPDGGVTVPPAMGEEDAMVPGVVGDAGPPAQVSSLTPQTAQAGTAINLTVRGSGFSMASKVYFDAALVETTFVSDTELRAIVPVNLLAIPGELPVAVGVPGAPASRSNFAYFILTPVPGAPELYDYSPDNGLAGAKILLIGSDLVAEPVTIRDANNMVVAAGTTGTISWPSRGGVSDTIEITLPAGFATGPITVSNSKGTFRGKVFNVGQNLALLQGSVASASSQYNTTYWGLPSGWDNQLTTSWFSANYDCATNVSCTSVPWFKVAFAGPQTVGRIAMRGNRTYASGYDFIRGRFEVLGDNDAVLWFATYDLPAPDRDLDIVLTSPIPNARAVKFTSIADESIEPGFAELEVFAP